MTQGGADEIDKDKAEEEGEKKGKEIAKKEKAEFEKYGYPALIVNVGNFGVDNKPGSFSFGVENGQMYKSLPVYKRHNEAPVVHGEEKYKEGLRNGFKLEYQEQQLNYQKNQIQEILKSANGTGGTTYLGEL